jgi:hypothetical protein
LATNPWSQALIDNKEETAREEEHRGLERGGGDHRLLDTELKNRT